MQAAQSSFISSLMWTERVGFTAGIATLNKMKQKNVQKITTNYGRMIKRGWDDISKSTEVNLLIQGMDSIPEFKFNYSNYLELSTYFNQEMLNMGYLAASRLATSYSHNTKLIDSYLNACYETFNKISKLLKNNNKIPLKGPIRHDTFKRLN